MTTDGKAYYYVSTWSSVDDDYKLNGLDITIGTTDTYEVDGHNDEQGEMSGVSSYETLDEVKKALRNNIDVKWDGNRFRLDYSDLCDADRKVLDEYFTYSKQAENEEYDSRSSFDTDFATDADYEDGFVESDGARMERESFIPDTVDEEYAEPDDDNKEFGE